MAWLWERSMIRCFLPISLGFYIFLFSCCQFGFTGCQQFFFTPEGSFFPPHARICLTLKNTEMNEVKYFTKEGLQKQRDELERLKSVERPAISQQIAEAREKGDLSENAEYDAAKNAQAMLELRISKLEETLQAARVIDESQIDTSRVSILSKIKLKNLKNNAVMTYTLVPENEADIKKGRISVNSPIARGLLGKSVGESVEIEVPAGMMSFSILEISRG